MRYSIPVQLIDHLPIILSCTLGAVLIYQFHASAESNALFLGIIAGGLADLDNRLSGRIRNTFFTLLYFSVATFLVQYAIQSPFALALLFTVCAFWSTMAGALDTRYRTIAFASLLTMIYTTIAYVPGEPIYQNPLLIISGALLYLFSTLLVYLLFPYRFVQQNLVNVYQELSQYMLIKAEFFDPDEVDTLSDKATTLALKNIALTDAFNKTRNALFYRLKNQYRNQRTERMLQYYLVAQEIHERITSQHIDYHKLSQRLPHSDLIFRIARLIRLQGLTMNHFANQLQANALIDENPLLNRAEKGLKAAFSHYAQTQQKATLSHDIRRVIENLSWVNELISRLKIVADSAVSPSQQAIVGQDMERFSDMWQSIKNHMTVDSPIFRHAVRMAVIAASCLLLMTLLHLPMGYWILLTAILVCQPNYLATTTRLKQRILGTLCGVLIGSILPYFLPSTATQLFVMALTCALFFIFRQKRYSFSTFFITIQVIVGFYMLGMNVQAALYPRLLDTVLGALLAWAAVSYIWPDWRYVTLEKTKARALQADAIYLKTIMSSFYDTSSDDLNYRFARRRAHEEAARLANLVSDMPTDASFLAKWFKKTPSSRQQQKQQLRQQSRNHAFLLLRINYDLLSRLSALGSLRMSFSADVRAHLQDLVRAGEQLATCIEQAVDDKNLLIVDNEQHINACYQQILAMKPEKQTMTDIDGFEVLFESRYAFWIQLKRIAEQCLAIVHKRL